MKIFSVVSILLCLGVQSFSQTFIPKAGFTLSTLALEITPNGDIDYATKFDTGITIGLGFEIPFEKRFSFQPQLNFIQKGFRQIETRTSTRFEDSDLIITNLQEKTTYNFNYLEMPLLIKFYTGKKRIFIIGGTYAALALGGHFEQESTFDVVGGAPYSRVRSGIIHFNKSANYNDLFVEKQFDFGIQIGTGLTVLEDVVIEVRYSHGLQNLYATGMY